MRRGIILEDITIYHIEEENCKFMVFLKYLLVVNWLRAEYLVLLQCLMLIIVF